MLGRNSFEDISQIYAELAPKKKVWKPILERKSFEDKIHSESKILKPLFQRKSFDQNKSLINSPLFI